MLNAIEIATLRYYADPSFPVDHSAPAHPGMVEQLVRRGYLRHEMGSYNTTLAGEQEIREEAWRAAREPVAFSVQRLEAIRDRRTNKLLCGERFRVWMHVRYGAGESHTTWSTGPNCNTILFRSETSAICAARHEWPMAELRA